MPEGLNLGGERSMGDVGASATPTGPLAKGGAAKASPAKPSVPSAATCGHCGLEIHPSETGVRHFGFSVAHTEYRCLQLLRSRIADLELALDLALRTLERFEPGDSRAVSDEFVSMASVLCKCPNNEAREIMRTAIAEHEAASAIEAQRAATTEIGAVHESAARKGTPKGPQESNQ